MLLDPQRSRQVLYAVLIAVSLTSAPALRVLAQEPGAPEPAASPESVAQPEPGPEPEPEPTDDTAAMPEDEAPAPTADLAGHRERELRIRLERAVQDERDASLLWPWVTTSVGAAMLVTGLAIGVGLVVGCDEDSCTGPFWPSWLMMGGALVGAAGTAWILVESHDQAELRTRRYQIERELEYLKWNERTAPAAGPQAALHWRATFD